MSDRIEDRTPLLSKSRFLAGLQCYKRLYFECYSRQLADPPEPALETLLEVGRKVGELGRQFYPDGVLISEEHFSLEDALASTIAELSNAKVVAIYEAALLYQDIAIRADILARVESGLFDLIEVKASTSVREEHLPDVAFQLYVLEQLSLGTRRGCVAHLNRAYVYGGGEYNLRELFEVEDVTNEVQAFLSDIPLALEEMRLCLHREEPPQIETGRHCITPYRCPFYSHCHSGDTEHPIGELPRMSQKLAIQLEDAGIRDIREIPADFQGLNALQQRVWDSVVNNRLYVDPKLQLELAKVEYPIHFIDFETFNPALPLFAGTRPYQVIPFQWSAHILDAEGNLRHDEFLHEGFDDAREHFAQTLIATLGTEGSIFVYSSFEETRIRELADALPHLSGGLLALLDGRVIDLLPLVRNYLYHPSFHGSFSLKAVLPALVPDFGYYDLEINDGVLASAAYAEMILAETRPERRSSLRRNLLAYCKRDTEAMVRLFETLRQ